MIVTRNEGLMTGVGSAIVVTCLLLGLSFVPGVVQARTGDSSGQVEQRERQVQGLRRDTVQQINELLRVEKEPSIRFELMRRLGELYIEEGVFIRQQEHAIYARRFDQWEQRQRRGREPQLDSTRSTEMTNRGIRVYERMLREFSNHPNLDAILFDLAKILHEMGDQRGERYFLTLLENYPDSNLVPDTLLAVGEIHFDRHDMLGARGYYQRLLGYREHRLYPYGLYKMGWVFYNLPANGQQELMDNLRRAATALTAVVLYVQEQQRSRDSAMIDLRQEALRDLVVFWTDARDTETAWRFFSRVNEPESFFLLLERMAAAYEENGEREQAVAVYQRLFREAPTRTGNPKAHVRLVNLFYEMGRGPEVFHHLDFMRRNYLVVSPWYNANKANAELLSETRDIVELSVRRWGTTYHKEAGEQNSTALLMLASRIYTLYLSTFADNEHAYDIQYYLADANFEMKRYLAAGQGFLRVVEMRREGKHLHEAAMNAVLAFTAAVAEKEFTPLAKQPHQWKQPQEIPRERQLLIGAIDTYVEHFADRDESHPMRYTAATILFEYGHIRQAVERYARLAHDLPGTLQGRSAARRVITFYGVKEDWAEVLKHGRGFLAIANLRDEELRKFIYGAVVTAAFKQAEDFERDKQYEAAAKAFAAFHQEFPRDPNAARALYNSFVNYQRVGDTELILEAASKVLQHFPEFEFASQVVATMADLYERILDFEQASRHYLIFARRWPRSELAPSALYNAAVLLRAIGAKDRSLAAWESLVEAYPRHQVASDALREQAEIYEELADAAKARDFYLLWASRIAATNANLHAEALAKGLKLLPESEFRSARGRQEVQRLRDRLRDRQRVPSPVARQILAERLLKDLEAEHQRYQTIDLVTHADLNQGVEQRQQALENLVKGYEDLMSIASPAHSVKALYQIGLAHEQFADELLRYATLAAVQDDQLGASFVAAAEALRTEAYQFYQTGYDTGAQLRVMSAFVTQCYEKMVQLRPDEHRKFEYRHLDPGYLVSGI